MAKQAGRSGGFPWRRWNNILHRDLGYFAVALTLVYAISGVAVNHTHQWNPNYNITREERIFEPIEVSDRATMVLQLMDRLELDEPPHSSFRSAPEKVSLYYDGWSVEADATEGRAVIESARKRVLLHDVNFLHLNHGKGAWTWFADAYAVVLALLAITGIFVLRGRKGFAGRGKWFILAGLALPVFFLVVQSYLA